MVNMQDQDLSMAELYKLAVMALVAISVFGFCIGHMLGVIWSLNLNGLEASLFSFVDSFEAETIKQLALAEY